MSNFTTMITGCFVLIERKRFSRQKDLSLRGDLQAYCALLTSLSCPAREALSRIKASMLASETIETHNI